MALRRFRHRRQRSQTGEGGHRLQAYPKPFALRCGGPVCFRVADTSESVKPFGTEEVQKYWAQLEP